MEGSRNTIALFVCLVAVMGIAAYNAFVYISAPTDDNVFMAPPSQFMVLDTMYGGDALLNDPEPWRLESHFPFGGTDTSKLESDPRDIILPGDLLLAVSGQGVGEAAVLPAAVVGDTLGERRVELVVYRPSRPNLQRIAVDVQIAAGDTMRYRRVANSAMVMSVEEGGASWAAGMRVGDFITGINGQGFSNIFEADRLMRRARPGEVAAYTIVRNGDEVVLTLRLARFSLPFLFILSLVVSIIYASLAVWIAVQGEGRRRAEDMAWMLVLLSGTFILWHTRSIRPETAFDYTRHGLFFLLGYGSLGVWLYSQLRQYFSGSSVAQLRYWLVGFGAIGAAFVYSTTRMVIEGLYITIFDFWAAAIVFILVGLLLSAARRASGWVGSSEYVKASKIFLRLATVSGIISGMLYLVSASVFLYKVFDAGGVPSKVIFTQLLELTGSAFMGFAVYPVFFPTALLYAVMKYRYLGLYIRIRRNIQYTILSIIWNLAVISAVLFALGVIVLAIRDMPDIVINGFSLELLDADTTPVDQYFVLVIAACCTTLGAVVFRRMGQRGIDKAYFRSRYDYRRVIAELSDIGGSAESMEGLAQSFAGNLLDIAAVSKIAIIVRQSDGSFVSACAGQHSFPMVEVLHTPAVVTLICTTDVKGTVRVGTISEPLKSELQRAGAQLLTFLFKDGICFGLIATGDKLSESTFDEEDYRFLNSAAKQLSQAYERLLLYRQVGEQERLRHELAIARRIQEASLPQTPPELSGFDLAGKTISATEVGGDFYDFELHGQALRVIVGDVSGKGTSAALHVSRLQGVMRTLHDLGVGTKEMLLRLNDIVRKDFGRQSFVTVSVVDLDSGDGYITVRRAGHLPLYRYVAGSRKVAKVTPKGLGLGMVVSDRFGGLMESVEVEFAPGDAIVLVSDGVVEARNADGAEYGEERLQFAIRESAGAAAADIVDKIIQSVYTFSEGCDQHDDITVVVVVRR